MRGESFPGLGQAIQARPMGLEQAQWPEKIRWTGLGQPKKLERMSG